MRSEIHMFADQPRKQTTKREVYGIGRVYKRILSFPEHSSPARLLQGLLHAIICVCNLSTGPHQDLPSSC